MARSKTKQESGSATREPTKSMAAAIAPKAEQTAAKPKTEKKPVNKALNASPGEKPAEKDASEKPIGEQHAPPEVAALAPDFTLDGPGGKRVSLSDFRGKRHVVLYFYPKDDTPGCTIEAQDFHALGEAFHQAGAQVLGVSGDDAASHERFCQKYGLSVALLSDAEFATSKRYGVYKNKETFGRAYQGIERTTFVIDKAGVIRKTYPKVKVKGHAAAVLAFVQGLE